VRLTDFAGIVPRAVHELVDEVNRLACHGVQAQLTFSFLQIYQENIADLLKSSPRGQPVGKQPGLQVREDPVHGIYVAGLTQVIAGEAQDVLTTIAAAAAHRTTHSTAQNGTSSRSHALLQFTIEQCVPSRKKQGGGGAGSAGQGRRHVNLRRSSLTLVDLAGSERVAKSRSNGPRLEEAKKINKSIAALGNCVAALAEGRADGHVPFRDSKLTRLLTDTLGGNAKACICANIGPSRASYDETVSTLVFASRAMTVRHRAVVNEMYMAQAVHDGALSRPTGCAEDDALVEDLRQRNGQLEEEMAALKLHVRNNERNKDLHSQGLTPPPPPGAPFNAGGGGARGAGSTTRYQMPDAPGKGQPVSAALCVPGGGKSVEALQRTVNSLQQQLAQKNIQIAQLQHANRKAQQAQTEAQHVPPPQVESPGVKDRQLLQRIAKQLSLISPLRDHIKRELAMDI
jgi:hypothetical protein